MRILYKPFSLVAAAIAARLGKAIFRGLWSRIDAAEPPEPSAPDVSMAKAVGAAALEAASMAGTASAVDRATAQAFHHLTGIWPGKKAKKKDE